MPATRAAACLGDELKAAIEERFPGNDVLVKLLDAIPSCVRPDTLELAGKSGKVKRAPSEYNRFIGTCMKAKDIHGFKEAAPAIKACALEWKKQQGR